MENQSPDEKQMLSLCLKVLHCLRNNLFHGEKWKYHFTDQYDNFKAANDLYRCYSSKRRVICGKFLTFYFDFS